MSVYCAYCNKVMCDKELRIINYLTCEDCHKKRMKDIDSQIKKNMGRINEKRRRIRKSAGKRH